MLEKRKMVSFAVKCYSLCWLFTLLKNTRKKSPNARITEIISVTWFMLINAEISVQNFKYCPNWFWNGKFYRQINAKRLPVFYFELMLVDRYKSSLQLFWFLNSFCNFGFCIEVSNDAPWLMWNVCFHMTANRIHVKNCLKSSLQCTFKLNAWLLILQNEFDRKAWKSNKRRRFSDLFLENCSRFRLFQFHIYQNARLNVWHHNVCRFGWKWWVKEHK